MTCDNPRKLTSFNIDFCAQLFGLNHTVPHHPFFSVSCLFFFSFFLSFFLRQRYNYASQKLNDGFVFILNFICIRHLRFSIRWRRIFVFKFFDLFFFQSLGSVIMGPRTSGNNRQASSFFLFDKSYFYSYRQQASSPEGSAPGATIFLWLNRLAVNLFSRFFLLNQKTVQGNCLIRTSKVASFSSEIFMFKCYFCHGVLLSFSSYV
jgi:hypothetical protein